MLWGLGMACAEEDEMVVTSEGEAQVVPAARPPAAHRRRVAVAGDGRALRRAGGGQLQHPPLCAPRAAACAGLRGAAVVARLVRAHLGVAVARGAPQRQQRQQQLQLAHGLHLRHRPLRQGAAAAGVAAGLLRVRGPHRAVHRAGHAPAGVRPPPAGHHAVVAGGPLRPLPMVFRRGRRAPARHRRGLPPRLPAAAGQPRPRVPGIDLLVAATMENAAAALGGNAQ